MNENATELKITFSGKPPSKTPDSSEQTTAEAPGNLGNGQPSNGDINLGRNPSDTAAIVSTGNYL